MPGFTVVFVDDARHWSPDADGVRFFGIADGEEIEFRVSAEALDDIAQSASTLQGDEAEAAFDANNNLIYAAAHKIAAMDGGAGSPYLITAELIQDLGI